MPKPPVLASVAGILDPARSGMFGSAAPERVDADHASVEVIAGQLLRARSSSLEKIPAAPGHIGFHWPDAWPLSSSSARMTDAPQDRKKISSS